MKKVFAFILVLCMVLSCMPAFASMTHENRGDGACGYSGSEAHDDAAVAATHATEIASKNWVAWKDGWCAIMCNTNSSLAVPTTGKQHSALSDAEKETVGNGDGTYSVKCAYCDGVIATENCTEHTGGTATCTEAAVCSRCNTPYGEPLGHTAADRNMYGNYIDNGDGTHSLKCGVEGCNAKYESAAYAHAAAGEQHLEWTKTATTHKQTCKWCGGVVVAEEAHELVYNAKTKKTSCSECGWVSDCTHANKELRIGFEPFCVVAGDEVQYMPGQTDGYFCPDCELFVEGGEVIPATGKHTNATENIIQEATCYQAGVKYVVCKDCGFKDYVEIPTSTAHEYVNIGYLKTGCKGSTADNDIKCVAATCTAEGLDHYVCSICGDVKHEKSAKTEHTLKTVYVNGTVTDDVFTPKADTEAKITCEEAIASYQKCSKCDYKTDKYTVISKGEKHECTKTKSIVPTCDEMGGVYEYCENVGCEYGNFRGDLGKDYGFMGQDGKFSDSKTALSHDTSDKPVIVAADTCTTEGKQYFTCKYCSARFDSKDAKLADGKYETVDVVKHTNEGKLTACFTDHKDTNGVWTYVAPTCKTNGYWESNCEICENNYRKVSFDKCDSCKAGADHHNWVMGAIVTEPICEVKNGTAQTVCSVCGTVRKDADGKDVLWEIDATTYDKKHDYKLTDETYLRPTCQSIGYGYVTCARCGKTIWVDEIPAITHEPAAKTYDVFVEETCTQEAHYEVYCSICKVVVDWKDVDKKPTTKNDITKDKADHEWNTVGTAKLCGYRKAYKQECEFCGATCILGVGTASGSTTHTPYADEFNLAAYMNGTKKYDWVPEVTCTTNGYFQTGHCQNCDYVAADTELVMVPAQHLGTVETIKTEWANCTNPKTLTKTCSVCKETWTETEGTKLELTEANIKNRTSHTDKWGVVKYVVKETCTENGKGYYGCPDCGYIEDELSDVPAAHSWNKELVVDKAPTCGDTGLGHKVCSICGYEDTVSVEIPTTGKCSFGTTIVKAENCEDNGYVTFSCLVCGKAASAADLEKNGLSYVSGTAKFNGHDVTVTNGTASYKVTTYTYDESEKDFVEVTVDSKKNTVTINNIVTILPKGMHVWGTPELHEATCTEDGGLHHVCKVCGADEYCGTVDGATPHLGHDIVSKVTSANCYMDGVEVFSCLRCGEILGSNVLKTEGHTMDVDKAGSVASTCCTKGYKLYVCQNDGCGYSYKETQGYDTNKHTYVYDAMIREATCTNNGLAIAHCVYCKNVKNELVQIAAKHNYEVTGTKVAATCTNNGVDYVKCTVCGKTGTQASKALGHKMVTETVEASCEQTAGILTHCSVCSLKTKFIKTGAKELGHDYGAKVYVAATCEKDAHYESTCARCGEVADTAITDSKLQQAAYNHVGKKLIEEFEGNCTEKAYDLYYCARCGENVKVEKGLNYGKHVWEIVLTYGNTEINCGNPGYAKVKCALCGYETQKYHEPECTWTENIITDDIVYKVCTVCGKMNVIWTSDTFTGYKGCMVWNGSDWEGTHKGLVVKASKDATCTEAGELGHIECTVCGTVIRVGGVIPAHTTKEVAAVEATCTTEGSTAGTFCLVCNKYVVAPQKIAAKGHKWVEVPAQDATATKPGYTAGTQCENCKEWKEGHEEIPVKAASLKRTAVLRKTAELLGERVALLNTDDAITITGELVNGFYPVSTADGTGYIHNSYIAVA